MKRTSKIMVAALSLILVSLVLPLFFRKKDLRPIVGPHLSDVRYSEIVFENPKGKLRLSGMMLIPEGQGPFPVAVFIHGSGASRRDNVWYLSVAKYLQVRGIAVLLPDKRGCEKSEGEWLGTGFEELATDTVSAVEYVKHQRMFQYSSIGVIGFSQGGWIAPIVATQTDDVSFIVSMSGSAVTVAEQVLHEQANDIARYTYPGIAKLIAPLTTNSLRKKEHLMAFIDFDPIPYWRRIHVPVFFAFGENDANVPVDASIERLNENALDHFKAKIYPGGGHAIRDRQTAGVSEEYLRDLVEFIQETARTAK